MTCRAMVVLQLGWFTSGMLLFSSLALPRAAAALTVTQSQFDQIQFIVSAQGGSAKQIGGDAPGQGLNTAADFDGAVLPTTGIEVDLPAYLFPTVVLASNVDTESEPGNVPQGCLGSPTDLTFTSEGVCGPDCTPGEGSLVLQNAGEFIQLGFGAPLRSAGGTVHDLVIYTDTASSPGSTANVEILSGAVPVPGESAVVSFEPAAAGSAFGGISLDVPDGTVFDAVRITRVSGTIEIDALAAKPSASTNFLGCSLYPVQAVFHSSVIFPGLREPRALAVSPDGLHVLVTSFRDDGVVVFNRNGASGDLTFASGVGGIDGATSLAISPNGEHVYVAGEVGNSLTVFARDATTGALTFVANYIDGSGGVHCLRDVSRVIVSSDGAHVYATAAGDHSVTAFLRDPSTGQLTVIECERDGTGGVDGLQGASSLSLSCDGAHLYVTGGGEGAVVAFARNVLTGQLSWVEQHRDGVGSPPVDGLAGGASVTATCDGGAVYVAGEVDDAVAVFRRNAVTGKLHFVQAERSANGALNHPIAVLTGPNRQLYVADRNNDRIVAFRRDRATASIGFAASNGGPGLGLNGPRAFALSPDGRHLYVASEAGDAVAVLDPFDPGGTFCGDGSMCTDPNVCNGAGVCVGGAGCLEGNSCIGPGCDPGTCQVLGGVCTCAP